VKLDFFLPLVVLVLEPIGSRTRSLDIRLFASLATMPSRPSASAPANEPRPCRQKLDGTKTIVKLDDYVQHTDGTILYIEKKPR
jgi:hypothetical protein